MDTIDLVAPTVLADKPAPVPSTPLENRIERYGRFWAVYDSPGQLVCVTVYKKGALEIVRRLRAQSQ